MTRKRSSPMGLEIFLPVLLAFIMLPLLTQAAPLQDYTEIQQYTEGCYYNYNHYNEGDRIMTNEPCLNCTCHNKMLMCYLRVCPFTKPIGHDCIVEKREDQCCPIITCPEVPVDVAHAASEPGTELSFPEKFGCSIEGKFYLEGAQVPSNPNKPCELCYCIKNRTSCLMQECTLHIDGCTPIYNKGSCCPVRYNCDHENDVLELEDHSSTTEAATTTTTERPTTGFILSSTMSPSVSTDCIHNKELYADGARIPGETACENCYCMRGDIVCAVQECQMPMLRDKGKLCQPMPAAEGECCPSNYVCEDDSATTEIIEASTLPYNNLNEDAKLSTAKPVKDLHSAIPEEDLQLQTHIDEEETATKIPAAQDEKEEEEEKEEKVADVAGVRKPIATETQQDGEKETTTELNENAEITTVSPSDVKVDDKEETVSAVPTFAEKTHETATEKLPDTQDEDQLTTTMSSEHAAEEDEKEDVTKVPTDASESPEISTHTAEKSEEYTTSSYAEDKLKTEEIVTKSPLTDEDIQSATEITDEKEHEKQTEESTEPTEEIKSDVDVEQITQTPPDNEKIDVTQVSEKESKPLESDDSVTETSETEKKTIETYTQSSLDTESTTELEDEEQTETKAPLSAADLTTAAPMSSFEEKQEEQSTKSALGHEDSGVKDSQVAITEENIDATTHIPEDIALKEADIVTEVPVEEPEIVHKHEDEKVDKEQQEIVTSLPEAVESHEQTTEFSDRKEPIGSTVTSAVSEEEETTTTKLPVSADEKASTTLSPATDKGEEEEALFTTNLPTEKASTTLSPVTDKGEEEEELFATTLPTDASHVPAKAESEKYEETKPLSEEEEKYVVTTGAPAGSEDHTVHIAETKPLFDDELGSGDDNVEETSSEMTFASPAMETVTTKSHEEEDTEEEYATAKSTISDEKKPIKELTSPEASEESDESTESVDKEEEHTTAKPVKENLHSGESEESAESEEDKNLLDLTTTKPIEPSIKVEDNKEDDGQQIETSTTIKPLLQTEDSTTAQEKDIVREREPSEENIDVTTTTPSIEEKLSTVDKESMDDRKDLSLEETEASSTPGTIEGDKYEEPKHEPEEEQKATEKTIEFVTETTQKYLTEEDEQMTTSQTLTTGEEDEHKGKPESGEDKTEKEETETSESPKSDSTSEHPDVQTVTEKVDKEHELQPTSESPKSDSTSEHPAVQTVTEKADQEHELQPTTSQAASSDAKGDFEDESTSTTTTKTFVEPSRAEQTPDMQLPSTIPGEGDCLVGEKTFENNSFVPTSNECEVLCKCVSSIVVCERVKCDIPENVEKCSVEESSSNKCCPTYNCNVSQDEESAESIEKDGEKITGETTIKPVTNVFIPGMSIPEIEMTNAFTEEPMSHVKHEDEMESQTFKTPIQAVADDKHDTLIEDHSTTAPASDEELIVAHPMAPVESDEKEKPAIVTDDDEIHLKVHDSGFEATSTLSQEQAQIGTEEHTTLHHDLVESSTASTAYVPSEEKKYIEMQTSSSAAPSDEYQTVKPIEEEGSGDDDTDIESQTAVPIFSMEDEDKTTEGQAAVAADVTAEPVKETEAQTDKELNLETTEEPSLIHPVVSHIDETLETQTVYPHQNVTDDFTASIDAQKDIQTPSPTYDLGTSTESAEQTQLDNKDVTTIAAPSKEHELETEEEDITLTTAFPSADSSTANPAQNEVSDLSTAFDESSTTVASVTEKTGEIDLKSAEKLPEDADVKPFEKEPEIEQTTVVYETEDKEKLTTVKTVEDDTLEHTSPYDEHKDFSEGTPSSTNPPETHIIDHTINPVAAEYDEKKEEEKEVHTTASAQSEEETLDVTTPIISQDIEISTDKPIDYDIRIDTSSLPTSIADLHTTVSPDTVKVDENKESEEEKISDISTEGYEEENTEEEKIAETTELTKDENATRLPLDHVKDEVEISMDHTMSSLAEEQPTTKSSISSDETKPEEGEQSTIIPLTSDEYTTEAISPEYGSASIKKDEIIPEPEQSTQMIGSETTQAPTKQPALNVFEEGSGESVESEEEVSTKPAITHNIGDSVNVDDKEKEASGEESEDVRKTEETTERQEHEEIYTTTEQVKISIEKELDEKSADKLPTDDKDSITEMSPSDITTEQATDKFIIPSISKDDLDKQQPEKESVPSIGEEETLTAGQESTQGPKETDLDDMQGSTEAADVLKEETESDLKLKATQTPTILEDKDIDDIGLTKSPLTSEEIETVTTKQPLGEKEQDVIKTGENDEQDIEVSTLKTYLSLEDDNQVTDRYPSEEVNVHISTKSPISSEEIESTTTQSKTEEESEEPKVIESVTAKLPIDENEEETTGHIPAQEIDQSTGDKDTENNTLSGTRAPTEKTDVSTTEPSVESEDNLDVKKAPETLEQDTSSTGSPAHGEDVYVTTVTQLPTKETEQEQINEATDTPIAAQPEDSESTTIIATKDAQIEEEATVIPQSPITSEISTEKLPEIKEQMTEQPFETHETEKDQNLGETTYRPEVLKDLADELTTLPTKDTKYDEEPQGETTEIPAEAHVPTASSENVTDLSTEDIVTESKVSHESTTDISMSSHVPADELTESHTELPPAHIEHEKESKKPVTELPSTIADVSTVSSHKQDSDLPAKETSEEDEKFYERTTSLPNDSHKLDDVHDATISPVKDIESETNEPTKSSESSEVFSTKSQEHTTELPTIAHEGDEELAKKQEPHEHVTQSPEEIHISTEQPLRPIESMDKEDQEQEFVDKLYEHATEAPANDVESEEDVYEKPTEKQPELPIVHEESEEEATETPVTSHSVSTPVQVIEASTESAFKEEESLKETSEEESDDVSAVKQHVSTTVHPLFAHHSTLPSAAIDSRIDDTTVHSTSGPTKNEVLFTTPSTISASSTTTEPITTTAPHYQPQPPPIYGQPPQYGPTQYEDEYTDEDEGEVFGPGTCRYGGKLYVSAQQIPRDDPCDFCFCFRSDIICLQQSCPPPIAGCHEEPISGFCCPRYECPVSMATVLNITTSTTTTSTTLPPHFLHHSYGNNVQRNGCLINGRSYRVGEKIESTSGPCINCTCGGDGKMKCDPQACVPEPTMQQVMAVVAAGRKR